MAEEVVKREPTLILTLRAREPLLPLLRPFRATALDALERVATRFRTPEVLAEIVAYLFAFTLAPLVRAQVVSFLRGERVLLGKVLGEG